MLNGLKKIIWENKNEELRKYSFMLLIEILLDRVAMIMILRVCTCINNILKLMVFRTFFNNIHTKVQVKERSDFLDFRLSVQRDTISGIHN